MCYGRGGARSSQTPGERWTAGRPRHPSSPGSIGGLGTQCRSFLPQGDEDARDPAPLPARPGSPARPRSSGSPALLRAPAVGGPCRGRAVGLEAVPRRGKAPQRGFALLAVRSRAQPCRARSFSPPPSRPGFIYLCPRAVHTMKRPCEETTSDSDMDETIDVGSENNYSG